jgi:hypothetical protein
LAYYDPHWLAHWHRLGAAVAKNVDVIASTLVAVVEKAGGLA